MTLPSYKSAAAHWMAPISPAAKSNVVKWSWVLAHQPPRRPEVRPFNCGMHQCSEQRLHLVFSLQSGNRCAKEFRTKSLELATSRQRLEQYQKGSNTCAST